MSDAPKKTLWKKDPHTQAKHDILRNYLNAWFPIMARYNTRIIYLDAFSGPGLHADGELGSPIIALQTAHEHILADQFKAELVFIFIEKRRDRAEHLEGLVHSTFPALPKNFKYEVVTGTFCETFAECLDDLESKGSMLAPTFAFIDPFGFSGIPLSLISRMMKYSKCEVLVTFMTGFINRFHEKNQERSLDELFATERWREVREIKDSETRRAFILDLYTQQLKDVAGAKYVLTFEMVNKFGQPEYHLVYGTTNIKGIEVMKDAMYSVDRRMNYRFSDRERRGQTYLLDYSDEVHWSRDAARMVFERFRGRAASVEEIKSFILLDTPFVFKKKLILKALEQDSPSKIVDVSLPGGRPRRRNTYPPGCRIKFTP